MHAHDSRTTPRPTLRRTLGLITTACALTACGGDSESESIQDELDQARALIQQQQQLLLAGQAQGTPDLSQLSSEQQQQLLQQLLANSASDGQGEIFSQQGGWGDEMEFEMTEEDLAEFLAFMALLEQLGYGENLEQLGYAGGWDENGGAGGWGGANVSPGYYDMNEYQDPTSSAYDPYEIDSQSGTGGFYDSYSFGGVDY